MKIFSRLALICLLLLLVAACGNKGDLVMPDRPQSAATP
jgi:predicted small lipoprotein YifL